MLFKKYFTKVQPSVRVDLCQTKTKPKCTENKRYLELEYYSYENIVSQWVRIHSSVTQKAIEMEFSVSRSHTRNFMNQSYEHFSMFRSSVKNAFFGKVLLFQDTVSPFLARNGYSTNKLFFCNCTVRMLYPRISTLVSTPLYCLWFMIHA